MKAKKGKITGKKSNLTEKVAKKTSKPSGKGKPVKKVLKSSVVPKEVPVDVPASEVAARIPASVQRMFIRECLVETLGNYPIRKGKITEYANDLYMAIKDRLSKKSREEKYKFVSDRKWVCSQAAQFLRIRLKPVSVSGLSRYNMVNRCVRTYLVDNKIPFTYREQIQFSSAIYRKIKSLIGSRSEDLQNVFFANDDLVCEQIAYYFEGKDSGLSISSELATNRIYVIGEGEYNPWWLLKQETDKINISEVIVVDSSLLNAAGGMNEDIEMFAGKAVNFVYEGYWNVMSSTLHNSLNYGRTTPSENAPFYIEYYYYSKDRQKRIRLYTLFSFYTEDMFDTSLSGIELSELLLKHIDKNIPVGVIEDLFAQAPILEEDEYSNIDTRYDSEGIDSFGSGEDEISSSEGELSRKGEKGSKGRKKGSAKGGDAGGGVSGGKGKGKGVAGSGRGKGGSGAAGVTGGGRKVSGSGKGAGAGVSGKGSSEKVQRELAKDAALLKLQKELEATKAKLKALQEEKARPKAGGKSSGAAGSGKGVGKGTGKGVTGGSGGSGGGRGKISGAGAGGGGRKVSGSGKVAGVTGGSQKAAGGGRGKVTGSGKAVMKPVAGGKGGAGVTGGGQKAAGGGRGKASGSTVTNNKAAQAILKAEQLKAQRLAKIAEATAEYTGLLKAGIIDKATFKLLIQSLKD